MTQTLPAKHAGLAPGREAFITYDRTPHGWGEVVGEYVGPSEETGFPYTFKVVRFIQLDEPDGWVSGT